MLLIVRICADAPPDRLSFCQHLKIYSVGYIIIARQVHMRRTPTVTLGGQPPPPLAHALHPEPS